MAQPARYQYVQVVGPVFVPLFDPSKLEWLPRGQQPARTLALRRLGDFVAPAFEALYRPDGLEWIPSDRYAGQTLLSGHLSWIVTDPFPPPVVFNPDLFPWSSSMMIRQLVPRVLRGDWVIDATILLEPGLVPSEGVYIPIFRSRKR